MKRLLLAVLLVAVVAMAGCAEGEKVEADQKADVPVVDEFATFERAIDGYGTCTFAVVDYDGGYGGGAGITLVGCKG